MDEQAPPLDIDGQPALELHRIERRTTGDEEVHLDLGGRMDQVGAAAVPHGVGQSLRVHVAAPRVETKATTCRGSRAATISISRVDRGSPASELAIDPPIVWATRSSSNARVTSSATPIGSSAPLTIDRAR